MRIAICEDEKIIAQTIYNMVEKYSIDTMNAFSIDVYYDARSFEESDCVYDLVFLDYKLPDKNGMDIARRLRSLSDKTVIVFISAYAEHVFESFEVGAYRYLLKPVNETDVTNTLESFVNNRRKSMPIEVPTKSQTIFVNIDEILYIESDEKHCIVRLADKLYETSKALSTFQAEISSHSFFRTHRRYFVNMKYISEVEKNIIVLTNGERVEISRRNLTTFNKCYMNYLKFSM